MKKHLLLAGCLALLVCCGGCSKSILPPRAEIDKYEIVQVVGIDKCRDNPGQIEVTFISRLEKPSSGESGGGGTSVVTVLSACADTVFEADRNILSRSDKRIFFGYVDYFLIGEEAAKDDFTKYFDFVSRYNEVRFSPKVFLVKGPVKEFINKTSTGNKFIADKLEDIQEEMRELSNTNLVKIADLSTQLDSKSAAVILPVLTSGEFVTEKMIGAPLPEKDIQTDGYAVLKNFKLAGYLDAKIARGYNVLVNKVRSCPVGVTDETGNRVALEVMYCKTKVDAQFEGDALKSVTYRVTVSSNLAEQQSRKSLVTQGALHDLAQKQSETIRKEMEAVILKSKEFGIDCTALGEKIRMQHPFKWEKIKENWTEIYPSLPVNITVESRVERTYNIVLPNGIGAEGAS